ncbi:hypothetical protein HanRHA438_Chr16g0742241 [Helianthus annuus]|uniref:Protein PXR1-like n=1 Tax=Helianthus annuus TaxID=4232 RepID=A0A9K3GXC9_HELAN|nr:hypothetical protein HanXRQr2_Chr16g0729771 [Helianthus annuus]KAJ0441082.1 hypothetical protein HanIR_Chr16g0793721 [Helianthus annuus]KAJ0819756.1 hypothetical protein HanPSC8_Chr16g0699721 [Helianthus annuus]KAJ0834314.1 hypothetical protein HanRHA438_Chr16g0742241 [Helianthus annuus]
MGDPEENLKKEEKHGDKEGKGEKSKDKKKKKEKKEKNPEDKNDPTKLKAKLEKLDSKIQALNVKREELVKLIEQAQANAPAPA